MSLEFIDALNRDECKAIVERARARLRQLRIEHPVVYGIQRTFRGNTRYHTRVKGMGTRQCIATDLNHSALWLASSLEWAEFTVECFRESDSWKADWEVFELLKVEAVKLPCFKGRYGKNAELTGYPNECLEGSP